MGFLFHEFGGVLSFHDGSCNLKFDL
jgi:hypothetical protein